MCRTAAEGSGRRHDQGPPDLVVKSQAIDIIGFTLLLMQEKNLVHTSPGPRRSRFEPISLSAGYWFTTKSAGMWDFLGGVQRLQDVPFSACLHALRSAAPLLLLGLHLRGGHHLPAALAFVAFGSFHRATVGAPGLRFYSAFADAFL